MVNITDLVAIVGTGRNGSTLLARLLDGMTGYYLHPVEVNFLQAANDLAAYGIVRKRVHNNTLSHPLCRLDASLTPRTFLRYYRPHLIEMSNDYIPNSEEPINLGPRPEETLRLINRYTISEFVPAFLQACASWVLPDEKITGAIFKTIETPYIEDYEQRFSNMKFIHIIRNPIDTWTSMKRSLIHRDGRPAAYLGHDNLMSFLEYRWMPHARTILQRSNNPNHTLIRYEDLIEDSVGVLTSACQHLNLPLPKEPDRQTLLGGRHFINMQMNPSQKGISAPERPTKNMDKLFNYVSVTTDRERDLILLRTWDLARQFGYFDALTCPSKKDVHEAWQAKDDFDRMNTKGPTQAIRSFLGQLSRKRYISKVCRENANV